MPKRVTTVSTTVVRDGKRKEVKANTSFDFTKAEIDDLNAIHPGALRKGVNETAEDPSDETSPEKAAKASATDTPKTNKRKAAAEKDSTSKAATGDGEGEGSGEGSGDEDDDI